MLSGKFFMMSVVCAVAAVAGACSGSGTQQMTLAPSAVAAPASNSAALNSSFGISLDGAQTQGQKQKVAGEGTVGSLFGTCPELQMVVRGVRVTTDSSTTYEDGECGNLRAGTKVAVEGDFDSDSGSVLATKIKLVDQPGGVPIEGEGTVGARFGTCPTLTMVVHGYPVMTTSETTFVDGECEDIKAGMRIAVKGSFAAGSVLASEVTIKATVP
jgi:hypothetical protein